jgi:ribosome-associated heat shock protein Hsp15
VITPPPRQRIDQWLWHTRIFKTRSLAARMIEAGGLRINRNKVLKPGHNIQPGDVVTFMHANSLHVIEVVSTATRRGPAPQARQLYRPAGDTPCDQSPHGDEKGDAQ